MPVAVSGLWQAAFTPQGSAGEFLKIDPLPLAFLGRTVDFRFVTSSPGDSIRVVTSAGAAPEPASWAMLVGGFGLVGWRLRRRAVLLATA